MRYSVSGGGGGGGGAVCVKRVGRWGLVIYNSVIYANSLSLVGFLLYIHRTANFDQSSDEL